MDQEFGLFKNNKNKIPKNKDKSTNIKDLKDLSNLIESRLNSTEVKNFGMSSATIGAMGAFGKWLGTSAGWLISTIAKLLLKVLSSKLGAVAIVLFILYIIYQYKQNDLLIWDGDFWIKIWETIKVIVIPGYSGGY